MKNYMKKAGLLFLSILMAGVLKTVTLDFCSNTAIAHAATVKNITIDGSKAKGKTISLSNKTCKNLTIKNLTKSNKIKLKGLKVQGTLTLKGDFPNTISISGSKISNASIVKPKSKAAKTVIQVKDSTIKKLAISGSSKNTAIVLKPSNAKDTSAFHSIQLKAPVSFQCKIPVNTLLLTEKASNSSVALYKPAASIKSDAKKLSLKVNTSVGSLIINGSHSKIELSSAAVIDLVQATGASASLSGNGKVGTLHVKGNNTKVAIHADKIVISDGVSGTKLPNDSEKPSEDNSQPNEDGSPDDSNSGSSGSGDSSSGGSSSGGSSSGGSSSGGSQNNPSTEKSFVLTFDAGDGVIVGSTASTTTRTVKKDEKLTNVPSAENEYQPFVGWSETKKGAIIDFSTYQVTSSKTLYAVYSDKLQMNLRVTTGAAIVYKPDSKVMVNGNTLEEAISPKALISPSGAAFEFNNIGQNVTASLAVFSLNDSLVNIRLTKGIELNPPAEYEIHGTPIQNYDTGKTGICYTGLEPGEYRITCTLASDPKTLITRILYITA